MPENIQAMPYSPLLSRIANRRRQYFAGLGYPFGKVLELGAFGNPVFLREMGDDVKYLDWFSKQELLDMHGAKAQQHFDRMVDIDYVVKEHHFAPHINERFDVISASHVIEHIADLISWLNQLDELLVDGGRICLAVPDRRYTFDYFRPETEVTAIVRAHEEKLTRPSKWQIAENFYYYQKVDINALWAGEQPVFMPRFDLATALRKAEESSHVYTDSHCWVFTPSSLERVIADLKSGRFIRLHAEKIEPTHKGANEFWAILSRSA
jgi:SAM-dependent methyltransferase